MVFQYCTSYKLILKLIIVHIVSYNGIVAVGDISNKLDTAACKAASPIRYYTFVEMFDFLQDKGAQSEYEKYKTVLDGQSSENGNKKKSAGAILTPKVLPFSHQTFSDKIFLHGSLKHARSP